ncbi:Kelch repeat-containing protein [Streptomyces sp. NPDC054841]
MIALIVPLLALTATSANAQGVWLSIKPLGVAREALAVAKTACPDDRKVTCVYAIGGEGAAAAGSAEAFNPRTNAWANLPALPTPRSHLAATTARCPKGVKNGCVYAIGGRTEPGGAVSAVVEVYSPFTNTWKTVSALPTARESLAAATAPCPRGVKGLRGTCVYAIGGDTSGGDPAQTPSRKVEAYSPATDTWATVPDLLTARAGLAATGAACPPGLGSKNTCVYAIGGDTGDGTSPSPSNAVEVYNPATNLWSSVAPLPTARSFLGVAAAPCPQGTRNGCVYAVGGDDGSGDGVSDRVEAYSIVGNTWETLPSLPTPRSDLGAARASCPKSPKSRCVYAVGGEVTGGAATTTVEAFAIERRRH